jgi:hypothetical protein
VADFDETKIKYQKLLTTAGTEEKKDQKAADKRGMMEKILEPEGKSQNVKRVYVTFRHMDGFETVMAAYKRYESKWSRVATNRNYFALCSFLRRGKSNAENKNALKSMYFFKKWP